MELHHLSMLWPLFVFFAIFLTPVIQASYLSDLSVRRSFFPVNEYEHRPDFARRLQPTFHNSQAVQIVVQEDTVIATVDDDFLCGTLDWWPPEKCDYGSCAWGNASLLNLDLTNPLLEKALKALAPFKLRLGGSLQDQIVYDVGSSHPACTALVPNSSDTFGFTSGCLPMSRWDSLSRLFHRTGSTVAFGLNALYGRVRYPNGSFIGPWDSSNARDFIKYTVDRGYQVQAWELGNELGGQGIGTTISASQFADDVKNLKSVIREIYAGDPSQPLLVAPDSFFEAGWYTQLFDETGYGVVDVSSRHIYNLGPGKDPGLVDKILDPEYIGGEAYTYAAVQTVMEGHAPWSVAWIGEAGGAYNSGRHLVTDAFVSGFWYVDELGMAATFNNKAFCRQSLIGGNYGLLNTTTFHPNPDFYSALLWQRLVGNKVLKLSIPPPASHLRGYAHCHKNNEESITLILLNLSNQTQYDAVVMSSVKLQNSNGKANSPDRELYSLSSRTLIPRPRLEYHLSADSLQSQTVLLNGIPLVITNDGELPVLKPKEMLALSRISIKPQSIVFVEMQDAFLPACYNQL